MSATKASAVSGPSISRHGTMIALLAEVGPFEIGDGDLAVHALPSARAGIQCEVSARDIALALQLLLLRIHREGDVDREHKLDIDFRHAGALLRQI